MMWLTDTQEYLGTKIHIELETETDLLAEFWGIAEDLEQKFSRFRPDSQLSQFNENLNTWHAIDAEWQHLLSTATELQDLTDGAFDITIKSTLDSWGYDVDYSLTEKESASGLGTIELEDNKFRASAPVDFGSIGKGYFLDLVRDWLEKKDIKNAFINAGGDIFARGIDSEGVAWKIYFEDPRNPELVIGETTLANGFAGSSSSLQRQWRDCHHLVETKKLVPAQHMKAVYVQQANNGAYCDGLSTALFVMGFDKAKQLAEEKSLAVMLISPEGDLWRHPDFSGTIYTT